MKAFKKGQTVIHFNSYDRKGTWCFTRAVVKSCGAKKMTLENAETGEMMGCDFAPNADTTYQQTWKGETISVNHTHFTLADMTDEEAHALCLEHARLQILDENTRFDRCISGSNNQLYIDAIERNRAELHEPRSMKS